MNGFSWVVSHRQLVSAIIALVLPNGQQGDMFLADTGYSLVAIELPLSDRNARPYTVDLHLLKGKANLSLLVDCKTSPDTLKPDQIEKYMNTTGSEVVIASDLTLDSTRKHLVNPLFFVLPDVESPLTALAAACRSRATDGWGLVRILPDRFEIVHDELSDDELSASLTMGWQVSLETLPLERLPYEPDAPRWELADIVFRTILSFFASGRKEFSLEELCASSNELWEYLTYQHNHIRNRVRDEVRTIRRTALKGWLAKIDQPSGREEYWKFARRTHAARGLLAGFARRHHMYVSILKSNRDPRAEDFVRIDPEQLTLPFIVSDATDE